MILHVMRLDKFLPPFIELIDKHFGREGHKYVFVQEEKYEYGLSTKHNVEFLHTADNIFLELHDYMIKARKIILHGLWCEEINVLLYFNQNLLRKCYWVMWGGDFYFPEKHSQIKKEIIKKIGQLVTYIPGDIEYVRNEYQAEGKYLQCLMYPSNTYQNGDAILGKVKEELTVLVGNSADPSNNHSEILQQLRCFKDKNIKVIAPLSYGNENYAQQVSQEGKHLLGDKFQALMQFMPLNEYLKILEEVDVAIFNHKRQQAMGNVITLLGLGKKVYMRTDVAQWGFFQYLDVSIHDVREMNNTLFEQCDRLNLSNVEKIRSFFSKENLIRQLGHVFNG